MAKENFEKSNNVRKWLITAAWIGTVVVVIALIIVLHYSL